MSDPTQRGSDPEDPTEPRADEATDPDSPNRRGGRRHAKPVSHTQSGSAMSTLTAGLFSHVDAREVSCKVDGCDQTWTWTAEEQIRAFGQPPPKRMCREHTAQYHALDDREVACANPGCERTWTQSKAARVAHLQKTGSDDAPQRVCDTCRQTERDLADVDVSCRIERCTRTWRWTRDAQLKHRAWLRRQTTGTPTTNDGGGRRRRGKKRKKKNRPASDGPPPRLCDLCRDKLGKLVDREVQCKVHGCTRMVVVDRETQLRAWAALGTDDLDVEPTVLPKRMCDVCREFCRLHPDREVVCGRPGCERTWTYKTGAQLQAFLAGRLEDPIRLCGDCSKGEFARSVAVDAPPGVEVMPCIVRGCEGTWFYESGMSIAPADDGDQPLDRMCDSCRTERGEQPRQQVEEKTEAESTLPSTDPSSPAAPTGDSIATRIGEGDVAAGDATPG